MVPVGLRAVIEKCLEKPRDRRYQGANEVRAALEAIHTGSTPSIASLRYQLSHRPWIAVAAVVTVVAVAGVSSLDRIRERWSGDGFRVESLAVLPLENLSGDATQEFFADGLTEVLSTDLARLGALKHVTARGSVMRYKGTTKAPADIARELNVDALLTGSMLRARDRISITVQLLDPATGNQVWTNRYENDLRDVHTVRNEIVSAIVREIHAQLSPAERARLASARPVNVALGNHLATTQWDWNGAERAYRRATVPNKATSYYGMWGAYYRKAQWGAAATAARDYYLAIGDRAFADAIGTARDDASYRAGMRRAAVAMEQRAAERHVPANRIARMFAHAGDAQSAFEWLERAYRQREGAMMRLGLSWDWLDLHDDPRFHDLMKRMKLPIRN